MRLRPITVSTAAALLMLAGCGGAGQEGAGGVSPEEAQALDNAAEMLDASADGMAAPADMPIETESNAAAGAAPAENAAE